MRVISLFSGAGGLDLGLIQAGHEIVWANDHDVDAVETYRKNIGDHICAGDIQSIDVSALPIADVVVGGFPCQGFSQANLKRSAGDERNSLYRYFYNTVISKKPRYFLAENVRGILSMEGGAAIRKIISDFTEAGYRVAYKLFNVADYGVPQTRLRVIIAGTMKDLPVSANFLFPSPTHARHPETSGLRPWVTVSEALAPIPEPGGSSDALPNQVFSKYKVTDRNFTGHRKTDPEKPSPTILARGNGKGGVCAIMHPKNHRRMSVRESATVQTFPLAFEFCGALNSCYRQVGNAVPVRFAKVLGDVLACLDKETGQ